MPATIAIAGAMLAAVLLAWALRNVEQFGEPILLRDNFGLELALANHPAAVEPGDPSAIFKARHDEIHPNVSPAARAAIAAIGVNTGAKMALHWAVSLLGLAGIGLALRRGGAWHYTVIMALVPLLPYLLVQPTLRYRYLILVFFAADLVARGIKALTGRVAPAGAAATHSA